MKQIVAGMCLFIIFLICSSISIARVVNIPLESFSNKTLFQFDTQWHQGNPFVGKEDRYFLRVNIGAAFRMVFPKTLDSKTPIEIHTRHGKVLQYLTEADVFKAELSGRYLVYRSKTRSILFRYDQDQKAFREFVYLPSPESMKSDGSVIRWRYEGAELVKKGDGSVAFMGKPNPAGAFEKIKDNYMSSRINRFLKERQNENSLNNHARQTLFFVPPPEFIDGKMKTHTRGIRYDVKNAEFTLTLDLNAKLAFPLWVDPTLIADPDADVILNGTSGGSPFGDGFGVSVASAGDFNGDGIDDVIVGADDDDNNGQDSGSAFIFFGRSPASQLTLTADTGADVILNGTAFQDRFGRSVASAGDFNGDGLDDVIVGAHLDDNNGSLSGSAFIFFGRNTASQITLEADTDANVILNGATGGDQFGFWSTSAGDFNGDGLDDVIVSTFFSDVNGNNSGSGYIFFGRNPVSQLTLTADVDADLILLGNNAGDFFGRSVSSAGDFNGDGLDDIIIGAPGAGGAGAATGAAYVFELKAGEWQQEHKLTAADARNGAQFGAALSLSGSRVAVGSFYNDALGTRAGAVYVFDQSEDGRWQQFRETLYAPAPSPHSHFGSSLSLSGDRLLIGADNDSRRAPEAGAAYLFQFDGSDWVHLQQLTPDTDSYKQHFGRVVAIHQDRLFVSAPSESRNSGAIYVFDTE